MTKIALVHDWLLNLGGADRVLIELHKIFPNATIFALLADKKFIRDHLPNANIITSGLNSFPMVKRYHKYLFPLMPSAIESFNLSGYDIAISSSVIFSKGLILRPKTKHICYCYSPTRQLWDLNLINNKIGDSIGKHFLRIWDRQASDRADKYIAISEHIKKRIKKYYRRDAQVIYPPITLKNELLGEAQDIKKIFRVKYPMLHNYYLIVSRLYKHKNTDIAIEAFNKLNLPLMIIGSGPEYKNLKSKIENSKLIKLLGFVPDNELSYYYQNCKAFIMPQEEDFGLTPIEAMSFGKPVLALKKGGALETVIEGQTGEFFDDPIPEALANGVRILNDNYKTYNPDLIKSHARKFSKERFREEILTLIKSSL